MRDYELIPRTIHPIWIRGKELKFETGMNSEIRCKYMYVMTRQNVFFDAANYFIPEIGLIMYHLNLSGSAISLNVSTFQGSNRLLQAAK